MDSANRLDELLTKILEGNTDDWECLNRLEQYLICILTHDGLDKLGVPMNRLEVLLQALYHVVPSNAMEVLSVKLEEQKDIK
jgi:hypothetical protein